VGALPTALRDSKSVCATKTSSNKRGHAFVLRLSGTLRESAVVSITGLSMKVNAWSVEFGVQNATVLAFHV